MAVAGKTMVPLSEQEIVSCDTGAMGGNGCGGGNPQQALGWVKSNGICSESAAPYQCMDQKSSQCKGATCPSSACTPVLRGGDVTEVTAVGHSLSDLEAAVSTVPVSVAIEADQSAFQMYTGGILTSDACGSKLDHAVLAVGYGVDNGQKYWKVKNSWGSSWGEAGYIRIARGKSGTGECGIRGMACFATVKGGPPGPSPPPSPPSSCSAGCQQACSAQFGGPCCNQQGNQCLCCRAGQSCTSFGGCSGGADCNKVDLSINASSIVV